MTSSPVVAGAAHAPGLRTDEAARRLGTDGPNVVASSSPNLWRIVGVQFRNVVLVLLLVTAGVSGVSWRSRPGPWLTAGALGSALVAVAVPLSPLGPVVGFAPLTWPLLATIGVIAVAYLVLAETLKALLFRSVFREPSTTHHAVHHLRRAAARFGPSR
ncbi:cation-transporting P-type ATPase [Curtobacterium sp. NPDC098951]|uniref:cation-transporting P-type ATPase n=1 Tax=Curtobacterium sp. NPDC098951 TaxID=3363974 RepID=UPI0037FEF473